MAFPIENIHCPYNSAETTMLLCFIGYVFGRSDWCCPTEDTLRIRLFLVFFSASYRFRVNDPRSSPYLMKSESQNQFWRKSDPLIENSEISLRNDWRSKFTCSNQATWKSVKQKWPNRCVVFVTKNFVLGPSPGPLERQFYSTTLSPPRPSAKFRAMPSGFSGDIRENVFQTHYSIGVKSVANERHGTSNTCTGINSSFIMMLRHRNTATTPQINLQTCSSTS